MLEILSPYFLAEDSPKMNRLLYEHNTTEPATKKQKLNESTDVTELDKTEDTKFFQVLFWRARLSAKKNYFESEFIRHLKMTYLI